MTSTESRSTPTTVVGRSGATARVLAFAAALAAFGAGMLLLTPDWTVTPERAWTMPFWALVIAFGLAEATALHVEIRKESHSLSLACIPLMFGLLYTSPSLVLAAYVLGAGSTLLWIRKSDLIKVLWNVCLFLAEVGLAGFMVRTALADRLPEQPLEWLVPLGAVIAAELLSLFAVSLVIMAVDVKFRPDLFGSLGRSQTLAVLAGTFAVTALSASLSSPYMAAYALAPLIGVGVLLRTGGQLTQRFKDLQQLHTFTRALTNERGPRTLDIGLVELAQIMRTRTAGLAVVAHDDASASTLRMLIDDTFEDLPPQPIAGLFIEVLDEAGVVQLDIDDDRDEARELLRHLRAERAVAVRVLSAVESDAVLFVTDRLGMRRDFTVDEIRLFGSLANTLSSRLTNDRLVDRLETQAHTDALTGLPNRLSFEIGLTSAVAKTGHRGAVVMVDLDSFKEINDSLGHETGDRLLTVIADRLRSFARSTDMVARFGGDEFAIMVQSLETDDPFELANRITDLHTALTKRIHLEGITFRVGASVGAVEWPLQGTDSSDLLRRADTAMYEAKRNQLGTVWYQPALDATAPRRLDLYLSVSSAIENEHLFVHFQPQISLQDGRISGAEALVRWTHPAHGPVSPAEFVPLIVQAGLIGKLTRLVLRRATETAAMFQASGLDVPVSVNLTPRDLLDPNLVDDLKQLVLSARLEPNKLRVEITEDAMVVDFDTSVFALSQMRDLGISVAIDDFGTGYSSLQHLHRLPVDQLKVDRSFVSRLTTDPSAEAIVRASINLARDLGISTVAEGIEDAPTLRAVARLGCTEMQGYYVSRPVAVHDFIRWAHGWDPARIGNALIGQEATINVLDS